jgi:hypothetical protein
MIHLRMVTQRKISNDISDTTEWQMKMFKLKEPQRFTGWRQVVVINKPGHPCYGLPVHVWDYELDWGFTAFLKMKLCGHKRPVDFYRVESIWGQEYPEGIGMFVKWKPHELRVPFDPVNYYKDQPGDTRDDV